MNIDSARALKEEIASQVVPPEIAAIQRAGGFSITTFSLNRMTKAEPLVALGIAQGTGQEDCGWPCVCSGARSSIRSR